MKKVLLLSFIFILIFAGVESVYSGKMSAKDKKFFMNFTKRKRNLNTIKLKYLKRFFKLVDLSEELAKKIYKYKKANKYIKNFNELKKIGLSNDEIKVIKKYFIIKKPVKKLKTYDVDEIEAEIAESAEGSVEDSEEFEVLQKYKDNPLDLNKASMRDLQEFPFVSPIDAMRIIRYRKKIGKFTSVKQLKKVPGLDEEVYLKLKPFVTVNVKVVKKVKEGKVIKEIVEKEVEKKISGKLTSRYILKHPYAEEYYTKYAHSPVAVKNKLEVSYGKRYEGGVMQEKDIGEADFFDALKYYIGINDMWILKKVILGNYRLYFGQGLVFYASGGQSKGGEIVKPAKKKNKGIRPDLTGTENAYYWGAATEIVPFELINLYGFFFY